MAAADPSLSYSRLDTELRAIQQLRAAGELAEALATLKSLGALYPSSGRLQQELAHVHLALGDHAAATDSYRQAVRFNDALAESWVALESLFRAGGRNPEADEAATCVARLRDLPAPLAQASFLLNEGEIEAAEEITRAYLQQFGAHVQGMRLLAQICVKANVLDDAEMLLEHVLALRPDYEDARSEYASILAQRRRYLPALQEITTLLNRSPGNPVFRKLQALSRDGLGQSDEALRIYRQLFREAPQDTDLLMSMGHILETHGTTREAVEMFKAARGAPATFAPASLALSHIKSFRFSEEEIAAMRETERSPASALSERYQLCYALGKVLEARSLYEESFGYYARGSALKRSEVKSDPQSTLRTMQRQEQVCTAEFFAARRGTGCARPDPIFIVGMPRAGSTLLEQILGSHSQIDGTVELPDIPLLVHQFRSRREDEPPRYPGILAELTPAELRQLGESYMQDTWPHRRGKPFFTDKMPNNFRDVGFIHLILPNAKIIDARREAMACCFGNFKQLFSNGMDFKYSLEEIGRYYCQYVALMGHWERVLPGKILRVQHEDVVNDLKGSVQRMLDFLGLPFEPACLEFYKTKRRVRTISSGQVRRPINREGLDSWRHFEPWLDPLKEALAPLRQTGRASADA